jgi:anti-anti-sigma factor
MSGAQLTTRVEPEADGARIVLAGDLNGSADAVLAGAYTQAVAGIGADGGEIVLDFGATGYINSTGIALVVRLLAEARRERRGVRAVGLSDHYREIFRITRLSDFMTIEEPAAPPAG